MLLLCSILFADTLNQYIESKKKLKGFEIFERERRKKEGPIPGNPPPSTKTPPPPTTSNSQKKTTIPDIARGYGLFQCERAKDAIVSSLIERGLHGTEVKITYSGGPGFIWSDSRKRCISENGIHYGVMYNENVYCNIHPTGLPLNEWLDDFHGIGERKVEFTPF